MGISELFSPNPESLALYESGLPELIEVAKFGGWIVSIRKHDVMLSNLRPELNKQGYRLQIVYSNAEQRDIDIIQWRLLKK